MIDHPRINTAFQPFWIGSTFIHLFIYLKTTTRAGRVHCWVPTMCRVMLTVLGLVGELGNTIKYVILAMWSLGCTEKNCVWGGDLIELIYEPSGQCIENSQTHGRERPGQHLQRLGVGWGCWSCTWETCIWNHREGRILVTLYQN